MRTSLAVLVALAVLLVALQAQALPGGIKAPKIDKKAASAAADKAADQAAGAAQDKVVKDLMDQVNGSIGDLAKQKPAIPLDKGLFDVSSLAGTAGEQATTATAQVGKMQESVSGLTKKKADLLKLMDQVKKQSEGATGDSKAAAEKTLGELQGGVDRISAVETYVSAYGERAKAWQDEANELKALSDKVNTQQGAYQKRIQDAAQAAGFAESK